MHEPANLAPLVLALIGALAFLGALEFRRKIHAPRRSFLDRFVRFERPLIDRRAERNAARKIEIDPRVYRH